jgi:hypothetical protein
MIIKTPEQLEEAKKIVKEMLIGTTNPFVISVFQEMLDELNKNDVENIATPSYLSIIRFGYDIFNPLKRYLINEK